jgi:Mrp family chromosome partitioning ATPase
MSRNFELMQQLEWEYDQPQPKIREATSPLRESESRILPDRAHVGDEALELAHRVFLLQKEKPPRVAVFAGIDHGSGCSQVCASVAEVLARNTPGSVCLLEANFRTPSLPSLFNTANHYGFTDALVSQSPIDSFAKTVGSGNLRLISAGALSPDSSTLLTATLAGPRLDELRAVSDFVLLDAPPLMHYPDAFTLARLSDGIVLVLEAESTRREPALRVVEKLRSSNIPILGAVLNKRIFPIPEGLDSAL